MHTPGKSTKKIVILGDPSKSEIMRTFSDKVFIQDHLATLGADFAVKHVITPGGKEFELQLWNISNSPQFFDIRKRFYNGAKATIVVYDLTRKETFDNIKTWIDDITQYCGKLPTVCFANKSDLVDDEAGYDDSDIKNLSKELDFMDYYLTSAKTGKHVQDAFNAIIDILVKKALSEG